MRKRQSICQRAIERINSYSFRKSEILGTTWSGISTRFWFVYEVSDFFQPAANAIEPEAKPKPQTFGVQQFSRNSPPRRQYLPPLAATYLVRNVIDFKKE